MICPPGARPREPTTQWIKKTMKSTHRAQDHSLICSIIRLHRLLICLFRTTSPAPLHSFARLLAHSLAPELTGKRSIFVGCMRQFHVDSVLRLMLHKRSHIRAIASYQTHTRTNAKRLIQVMTRVHAHLTFGDPNSLCRHWINAVSSTF